MRVGADGPVKLETAARKNTLNPVWNASFTYTVRAVDLTRQLHIKVNDGRTLLGRAVISLAGLKVRPQVHSKLAFSALYYSPEGSVCTCVVARP